MPYRMESGHFDAIQWTGDNAQTVAQAASDYHGVQLTPEVLDDGSLQLDADTGFTVTIVSDHWYVMGPTWGEVRSGQSEPVRPDVFPHRFTPTEGSDSSVEGSE